MAILITGGAGFIGSHMAAYCLSNSIDFFVIDNLSVSEKTNLKILEKKFHTKINFFEIDIRNSQAINNFFLAYQIDSVIHFAGLKSVNESIQNPSLYYDNNVVGSKILLEAIKKFGVKNFIFSSSACVYGVPKYLPIDENHLSSAINPYGQTKIDIENLISNDRYFNEQCNTTILRYFNPIGSFKGGWIGENPSSIPNNLMPYIVGVATNLFPFLKIFGNDYPTPDGTAIRDYIHIMDLIEAHAIALKSSITGIKKLNVGTGQGYSVLEIVKTFEKVNKVTVPFKLENRRTGDVAASFANPDRIKKLWGWAAKRNLETMCKDSYNYAVKKLK